MKRESGDFVKNISEEEEASVLPLRGALSASSKLMGFTDSRSIRCQSTEHGSQSAASEKHSSCCSWTSWNEKKESAVLLVFTFSAIHWSSINQPWQKHTTSLTARYADRQEFNRWSISRMQKLAWSYCFTDIKHIFCTLQTRRLANLRRLSLSLTKTVSKIPGHLKEQMSFLEKPCAIYLIPWF